MRSVKNAGGLSRRDFFRTLGAGVAIPYLKRLPRLRTAAVSNDLFWVKGIPDLPFYDPGQQNFHIGLDSLLYLMADSGLSFYRSSSGHPFAGPSGLIAAGDVVLIKVNAQWKYRGCTNSDLIRGLVQRILDHPDGFNGEVVIVENGQGRGSLKCDTSASYGGDRSVHANANDESHHFLYLVDTVFNDPRVSAYLLDPIRGNFIGDDDHLAGTDTGSMRTSPTPASRPPAAAGWSSGRAIWQAGAHQNNLKLINVPVAQAPRHREGPRSPPASSTSTGWFRWHDGQSRLPPLRRPRRDLRQDDGLRRHPGPEHHRRHLGFARSHWAATRHGNDFPGEPASGQPGPRGRRLLGGQIHPLSDRQQFPASPGFFGRQPSGSQRPRTPSTTAAGSSTPKRESGSAKSLWMRKRWRSTVAAPASS